MRTVSSRLWSALSISVALLIQPIAVQGQTGFGTILGTVTDQTGAIVPGAKVSLRNEVTNVTSGAEANNAGEYTFSNVIPDPYEITVTAGGFQSYVIRHVILRVGQTVREDAALSVGSTQASVQVTAEQPLVQTDTTSVGSIVDSKQIDSVPLNGRTDIFGLLAIAPGVQNSGTSARIGGVYTRGGVSETIDGSQVLQIENAVLGKNVPSLDSIGEFQVIDSTGSAKYAGTTAVIMVTKSGTNEFHGSAFEYNRITALSAKNFFATSLPKPPFVRNEFGGSLGGPIKRNKLFFFGSFEGYTNRTSSTKTAAMPTQNLLNGNFAGLPPIIDPDTGSPFPNNQIPAARISPIAKNFFPYFDTPNIATTAAGGLGNNFTTNVANREDNMRYEGRTDYNINEANTLSVRYYMARHTPNYSAGATDKFGGVDNSEVDQDVAANYTHTISPTLVNLSSVAYHRIWDIFQPQNYNVNPTALVPGIPSNLSGLGGLPTVSITGFTGFSDNAGSGDIHQTFQLSDQLTWLKGNHVIDAGVSYMHWQFYNYQNTAPGHGSFTFNGQYSGSAFADFLLGDLSASSAAIAPTANTPANDRYGFFIQDSWKAMSRLTVNLGLRYDLPTLYQNKLGNMANWYSNLNEIVVLKGTYNPSLFPGLPIVIGSSIGLGPGNYIGNDLKQFAPRVGLAYRPLATSRLVLRAGYGMYYNTWPWGFGSYETALNPPFNGAQVFEPLAGPTPTLTFANPFPSGQGAVASGATVNAYPTNYRYPMSHEWNFTVESQVAANMALRATYLGIETEHETQVFNLNDPPPAPGPVQPRRPYQPFGPINFWENGQTVNSQALQLSALRRFSSGLSFEIEYSWTKTLDSGGTDSFTPLDNQDIRLDRGNDPNIRQQYMVANYVYDLPFGKGRRYLTSLNRPLNFILGGWGTTGILTLGSGLPFSVNFTSAVQGWPSGRANIVGNPSVSNPGLTQWFNPAAYALPAQFTFGNSAPYSLFGPGYSEWDASLFKNFVMAERFRLRFEGDFFNALNHPSFANPASNISVPAQVGRITATSNSPRNIQLSLRLEF